MAAAATTGITSSLRTLTMVVGAGYGGSYLYSHGTADALRGLAADFLLRDARRPATNKDAGAPAAADSGGYSAAAGLQALSAQVDRLSRDVQRATSRPVVVVSDTAARGRVAAGLLPAGVGDALSLAGWWTVVGITVGSAVYCYVVVWRRNGYSVKNLLWVSRAAFHSTVEAMQASVAKVSESVATVRHELTEKLRNIEHRVESVRAGLSKKIETEVAEVKDAVDAVGRDVEGVQDMLHGVNERMQMLDGKLDTATNGIFALVRVVSSLAPDNIPPNSAFSELRRFAELTTAHQPAARLTSSRAPSFLKSQIRSSFAAAALEGTQTECSHGGVHGKSAAAPSFLSRRDSAPLPQAAPMS